MHALLLCGCTQPFPSGAACVAQLHHAVLGVVTAPIVLGYARQHITLEHPAACSLAQHSL